jgi:PucR C-terminal helix-turn-helix domain
MEKVIVRLEATADVLSRRARDLVREELPTYVNVPPDSLTESAMRNVRRAIAALSAGRAPKAAEFDEAVVARDRADRGVPVEDVLRAYRVSLRVIRDAFLTEASDVGMNPDQVLAATQVLWDVTDAATVQLALIHREMAVERARHDERHRADFLRGLLFGTLDPADIIARSPTYGLPVHHRYWALRGRPASGGGLEDLKRTLERAGARPRRSALIGILDGDVAGVTSALPAMIGTHWTIGVGPSTTLQAAEQSFHTASRVLDVAMRFSRTGCVQLEDLSWRVAVVSEPELGAHFVRKYVEPLAEEKDFGDTLCDTVGIFLASGESIGKTAERLSIHVNTLRYRLSRFEQVTGASLSSADTKVEVRWALEARALDRPDSPSAAPEN